MYKINLIYLLLLLISPVSSYSQAVEKVTLGPDNEESTKILRVLGENSSGIFYMAAKGNDLYLQKYASSTMKLSISNKIDIPKIENTTLEIEDMFLLEDNILMFATGYSSVKEAFLTYVFKIDANCQISGKGKKVFEMPVEKKRRGGSVEYRASNDRAHLLIFNQAYVKSKEMTKFSFILLNAGGDLLTEQSFDVPDAEGKEKVKIENFLIDYKNDIHCVVSRSLYDRASKENTQKFEIFSYRAKDGYEQSRTEMSLSANKIISSVVITAREDGKLAVGGFYIPLKNGKKATGIEGIFFSKIDTDGIAEAVKTSEFTASFKSKFMSDRKLEKGFDLPLTYIMRGGFAFENNDVVFIAEDYIFTKDQMTSYYYGHIIVIRVNDEGQITWEQVINKRQMYTETKVGIGVMGGLGGIGAITSVIGVQALITVSSDKNIYLSYTCWSSDGNIIFLFNDNAKNEGKAVGEERTQLQFAHKGVPVTATITPEGKLSYFYETKLGDEETVLRPRMSVHQDGNLYYVSAKKSREKVGKATLK